MTETDVLTGGAMLTLGVILFFLGRSWFKSYITSKAIKQMEAKYGKERGGE